MDLRPLRDEASPQEREAIDEILGPAAEGHQGGLATARARRHLLLPALHAAQARVGWVRPGALGYVCERLGVPPAEAFGVASFYALFALSERPPGAIHLCDDVACQVMGAERLAEELTRALGPAGEPRAGGVATWHRSPCLGLCERAPGALVTVAGAPAHERAHAPASSAALLGAFTLHDGSDAALQPALQPALHPALPQRGAPGLRLLSRVGRSDPTSLDSYRAHGGYQALRIALDRGPVWVLREVTDAGLLGRGGAAFPTGRKWEAVARAPARPHYLVCNADESETGTFKDRVLLEEDPFAVVEAMTIAGLTTGCEVGYLYVRAEYPLAAERVLGAIREARARGLLGADVMGRGVAFDLEVRRGAGAYICGEETALLASMEGFRGEPRTKPPFPVEVGLFGKPTVINNVETLCNVPWLLVHGARAYRSVGSSASPGTRLFCVSGRVERPGLYEHAFGVTLGEVVERAGGVAGGRPLQAILLGGAAGTLVGAEALDARLTFEDTRPRGLSMGSGVVLVLDDTVPLLPVLRRIAAFFRDESCGQCVPCRVGTVRQEELVARLAAGRPLGSLEQELTLLAELGQAMRDASICGLGQTASSAIESAVRHLRVLAPAEGGAP